MKKVLIACIAIIGFSNAHAQFYVQGGVNFANISDTKSGNTEKNNILSTFNAGFLFRVNLYNPVKLETGLLVMGQGSKAETYFTSSTTDNYVKTHFNPVYLQLPVNAVVKIPMQGKLGIFFNAGPYLQMGIGGKSKIESKFLGITTTTENDIKYNNDNPSTSAQEDARYDKLKRFDFGLNLGAGIDIGKALLKVNYGWGFTKINSTQTQNNANDKNKYRTISVSVAFYLGS